MVVAARERIERAGLSRTSRERVVFRLGKVMAPRAVLLLIWMLSRTSVALDPMTALLPARDGRLSLK